MVLNKFYLKLLSLPLLSFAPVFFQHAIFQHVPFAFASPIHMPKVVNEIKLMFMKARYYLILLELAQQLLLELQVPL